MWLVTGQPICTLNVGLISLPHMHGRASTLTTLLALGHPSSEEHHLLVSLLEAVQDELGNSVHLNTFLTSDLGAPLPLHVSLSRPIVLTTGEKDLFLDKITESIESSSTHPFQLTPYGLGWYKSLDSDRTFLVLRVSTGMRVVASSDELPSNKELVDLLKRCNAVATSFDQPALYQSAADTELVEEAFHVSIAWASAMPDAEMSQRTYRLLDRRHTFGSICKWEVAVSSIKAKIGNIVTRVPLPEKGHGADHWDGETSLL